MSRLDRQQVFQRFREIARLGIAPHIEVGFIFWDRSTNAFECGASHSEPEDLIKHLGMWRDAEISAETLQRYEAALRKWLRSQRNMTDEQITELLGGESSGPRIVLADEVPDERPLDGSR